jgi:hypothetical protein
MSELRDVGRTFLLLLLAMSLGASLVRAFWEFEQVRERRRRAKGWILLIGLFGLVTWPAPGRDLDGKNLPLHDWFEHLAWRRALLFRCRRPRRRRGRLANRKRSLSCTRAESPQLQRYDLGRGPGRCRHQRANKAARTMVWPFYDNVQGFSNDESYPLVSIRCFMPGSMT